MSAWTITAKDLSLLLRDRRTFAILLLLPLLFILIIGMTTGQLLGWKNDNRVLTIAVIDQTNYEQIGSSEFLAGAGAEDQSPLTQFEKERQRRIARHLVVDIINGIQRTSGVDIRPLAKIASEPIPPRQAESVGRGLLEEEEVNALLIFQEGFYRELYVLEPGQVAREAGVSSERFAQFGIKLVTKNPGSSTASAVTAVTGLNVMDVLQPFLICRSLDLNIGQRKSARYQSYCAEVEEMARSEPDELLEPIRDAGEGGNSSVYDQLVPAYTVMFVFFLVNIMARSFLTEREMGTLRRLRIAPVRGVSILFGKTLPFFMVSLIQTAILFVAGRLLFGMEWGRHPAMLLPIIITTSAAATGLGLLIATLVRSDSQVSAYATTAVIVLAGISGCFLPRQWLPELMQTISLATPHAWALIAYNELLDTSAADLAQVWGCAGVLLLFSAAFFAAGAWRFRTAG